MQSRTLPGAEELSDERCQSLPARNSVIILTASPLFKMALIKKLAYSMVFSALRVCGMHAERERG